MSEAPTRRSSKKLVDPESWGLAVHFLPFDATDSTKQSLAEAIQGAVEDWFAWRDEVAERRKHAAQILRRHSEEQDAADAWIMVWAQRHPRVCASNQPTGEPLIFGGRAQR